jgi:putative inorganic carbon (HCO3(-)) transporter
LNGLRRALTPERGYDAAAGLMALALAASPAYTCGSVETVDCAFRYHVGPLPTNLLELLLLAALAFGLVVLRAELPWRNPYTAAALLLLLAATISVVVAPDRRAAAGLWKAYFVEPILAFVVIGALARRREHARWLLGGLGVAGLIVAAANLSRAVPALADGSFNTVTPPVAIYNSANAVPLYLVPLDAVAAALLLYSDRAFERLAAAAFLAVTGAAVALSFSRAGWVTLAVVLVFVAFFHRRRYWVLGGVAVVALASIAVPRVRRRVLVEFDFSSPDNSVTKRFALWRSTLNLLRHDPIFGSGLSGFKSALEPYRDPAYGESLIYPHNIVLNFWVETGLLGLVAFAWVLGVAVLQARRALGLGPWPRALSVGLLGLVVAFVVHGLADVPYFKNDQALAFWAILGIQLASHQPASTKL